MDQFELIARDGGYALRGRLGFETVSALWDRRASLLANGSALVLDLAELEQADSAGLACLLNLHGEFLKAGKRLSLAHVPAQLRDIARVSGIEAILPLEHDT